MASYLPGLHGIAPDLAEIIEAWKKAPAPIREAIRVLLMGLGYDGGMDEQVHYSERGALTAGTPSDWRVGAAYNVALLPVWIVILSFGAISISLLPDRWLVGLWCTSNLFSFVAHLMVGGEHRESVWTFLSVGWLVGFGLMLLGHQAFEL